jgi:hypothetical protein
MCSVYSTSAALCDWKECAYNAFSLAKNQVTGSISTEVFVQSFGTKKGRWYIGVTVDGSDSVTFDVAADKFTSYRLGNFNTIYTLLGEAFTNLGDLFVRLVTELKKYLVQ